MLFITGGGFVHTEKSFADLQRVLEATARGTFALLDKQLASVGCPRPWVGQGGSGDGADGNLFRVFYVHI